LKGRSLLLIGLLLKAASPTPQAEPLFADHDKLVVYPRPADYSLSPQGTAHLSVCYNWSCATTRRLDISAKELAEARSYMDVCAGNDRHEQLQRLRIGVWRMGLLAQRHIPVLVNDREVNDRDAGLEGRQDCVDNATNTTTYLSLLVDLGALPGWTVDEPQVRDLFTKDVHWTATVIQHSTGDRWAVDSWFRPNGNLPFVSPIADWIAARKPWEPPLDLDNPYPRRLDQLCHSRQAFTKKTPKPR
jgi:hypothetical protein